MCGYSVETSLEENQHDVAALYTDYFSSGRATAIHNVAKSKGAEYYGIMWYLEGHERYRYLLRKERNNQSLLDSQKAITVSEILTAIAFRFS